MFFIGILLFALFIVMGIPGYKDIIHEIKGEPKELPDDPIYTGMKVFFVVMPFVFIACIIYVLLQ